MVTRLAHAGVTAAGLAFLIGVPSATPTVPVAASRSAVPQYADGTMLLNWRSPLPERAEPGMSPQFTMDTLHVKVTLPNGPAPYRLLLIAVNIDDSRKYRQILDLTGISDQRMSVPAGHYGLMAIGTYLTGSPDDPTSITDRIAFALNRNVDSSGGSARLDLAKANVGGIWPHYTLPRPTSTSSQMTYLYLGDERHFGAGVGYEMDPTFPGEPPYQPLVQPVAGTANGLTTASHSIYAPSGDSPSYVYDLSTYRPDRLVLGEHFALHAADLAAVTSTMYADTTGRSELVDWEPHFATFDPGEGNGTFPLPSAGARVDYIAGAASTRWETPFQLDTDSTTLIGFGFARTFAPGRGYHVDLLRGPLAPGVASGAFLQREYAASRTSGELAVGLSPVVDTDPSHVVYVFPSGAPDQPPAALRTQIYRDGVKIFDGTNYVQPVPDLYGPTATPAIVSVPAGEHAYRIVGTTDLAQFGFTLSTRAVSDYQFRSSATSGRSVSPSTCAAPDAQSCTLLPLLRLSVPLPTDATGSMQPGRAGFVVTVGHVDAADAAPITGLTFATSLAGVHATPAVVVPLGAGRFRVTVVNPPGSAGKTVSIRVRATDADGSSLTETVAAAFRVASAS